MGIRESLEKQELEQKDLKLSDLNLEQEEKEERNPYFEPEKDIPEKEKRDIMAHVKKSFEKGDKDSFSNAYEAKILFPKEFSEAIDMNETMWQRLKERFDKYKSSPLKDLYHFLSIIVRIKSLFPEHYSKLNVEQYYPAIIEALREKIMVDRKTLIDKSKIFPEIFIELAYFKIVFPEKMDEINLEKIWEYGKELIEFQKSIDKLQSLQCASFLSIIFPQRIKESSFSTEIKKDSKEIIRSTKKDSVFRNFTYYHLAILSAEEIKFTDHGLELVMHKPADSKKTEHKRPERRINN